MKMENLAIINQLIANCNDLVNGKFILIDHKILSILDNINNSEEVYNLLANCMTNFNYESEFNKAILKNNQAKKITLPDEPEKMLPFIFCVLVNIKNNEINFDNFLKTYYSNCADKNEQIKNFIEDFIVPFRDLIAQSFNINISPKTAKEETKQEEQPEEQKPEKQTFDFEDDFEDEEIDKTENEEYKTEYEDEEYILEFYEKIQTFCNETLALGLKSKRIPNIVLEQITFITETLLENAENKDLTNCIALVTALKLIFENIKNSRTIVDDLDDILLTLSEE